MSRSFPSPVSLTIPDHEIASATIVGAESFLIDRFVPACEVISLPAKVMRGGAVRFGVGPLPEAAQRPDSSSRLKRGVKRVAQKRRALKAGDPLVMDFRKGLGGSWWHSLNWSHFLNQSLPLYFQATEALGLSWDEVQILLPSKSPAHITETARLFGIETVQSDDLFVGTGVTYEMEHLTANRPVQHKWVRSPRVAAAMAQLVSEGGAEIPRRVFISRRDTRRISNGVEIEAFLSSFGFVTLYAEQLSPRDQFRLFHEAETIVAVHGAGLAPLLFRPEDGRLKQIVEILPCGHMTDFFRGMAQQVGCRWIGVRGRIKPEYVVPAYQTQARGFTQFSLDDFEVDPKSLALAFEMANPPITSAPV